MYKKTPPQKNYSPQACTNLAPVEDWPLLPCQQAEDLEAIFKVLANATRLRLLHAIIRTPGISVSDLSSALGMKMQAVSNQLRRLVDKGIVQPVRDGNRIRYHIVNACTFELFNQGMCLSKAIQLEDEEDIQLIQEDKTSDGSKKG